MSSSILAACLSVLGPQAPASPPEPAGRLLLSLTARQFERLNAVFVTPDGSRCVVRFGPSQQELFGRKGPKRDERDWPRTFDYELWLDGAKCGARPIVSAPVASADGAVVAWAWAKARKGRRKWNGSPAYSSEVRLNGLVAHRAEEVRGLTFGPGSATPAFWTGQAARFGLGKKEGKLRVEGKWRLAVGGDVSRVRDFGEAWPEPDDLYPLAGGMVLTRLRGGTAPFVVQSEEGDQLFSAGTMYEPEISADRRRIAWVGVRDRAREVVRSTSLGTWQVTEHGGDASVSSWPVLGGPAGRSLAYFVGIEPAGTGQPHRVAVVANGKQYMGTWSGLGVTCFDPAGARVAFVGWNRGAGVGERLGVLSISRMRALQSEGHPSMPGCVMRQPVTDAEDHCTLYVDGAAVSAPWQRIARPTWSPDGAHLAFVGQSADGLHVIIGDWQSGAFERVGSPAFVDDTHVGFAALKGNELRWHVERFR